MIAKKFVLPVVLSVTGISNATHATEIDRPGRLNGGQNGARWSNNENRKGQDALIQGIAMPLDGNWRDEWRLSLTNRQNRGDVGTSFRT